MGPHPRAGQPARPEDLVDLAHLVTAYYTMQPDPDDPAQRVAFGTSGHRGSALDGAFNEAHILAITQAVVEYRSAHGITGPLFIGRDTHGLSEPAWASALEVLAANDVVAMVDSADRYTPTPAVSHAILAYNRGRSRHLADGVVVTPSHNPPRDGGFKYNPPHGGSAGSNVTSAIAERANEILHDGRTAVKRLPLTRALQATEHHDYLSSYVDDLPSVVDVDATWRFMTLDADGKIRMDCSSPDAMAALIAKLAADRDGYQLATGNDADADRHGIVTPDAGLCSPNHFLAVAIDYLFTHRPSWSADSAVGKTVVSSSIIDRVVDGLGHRLAWIFHKTWRDTALS